MLWALRRNALHHLSAVGQRGFTGAKEDAEVAILRAAPKPWFHTGRSVTADAFYTTYATARFILDHGLH